MTAFRSSLKFIKHEMVLVRDLDLSTRLWMVVEGHADGWLMEPLDSSGERHLFRHVEIYNIYISGRLKLLGRPARKLDSEEELRVQRAWEGAPAHVRAIADRRYMMLRACIEQRGRFSSMADAFRIVPGEIVASFGRIWDEEDRKLRPVSRAHQEAWVEGVPGSQSDELSPYWVPIERTMWYWYERCGNSKADVRKLLPRHHLKGDKRPLFDRALVELMDKVIEEELLTPPPKTVVFAYEIFKGRAEKLLPGLSPSVVSHLEVPDGTVIASPSTLNGAPPEDMRHRDGGQGFTAGDDGSDKSGGTDTRIGKGIAPRRKNDMPSSTTFWRRYDHLSAAKKMKAQSGSRNAHVAFGTFDEATPPPFLLNQVEVDHSFINMFVREDVSGRLLGRPWITAIRDRKTKVILGLHVSFLPPSWMTLSRAIAHAIWPKDLSSYPELRFGWDFHGVFDWLVTDRGVEFLGDGLRSSGRIIGFEIGNLRGFSPWLKGGLERWFRTMKGGIFSYREGTSAWRVLKHFDGRASTRMTYSELKSELIKWVVEEYHPKTHGSIGMSPADRWGMEVSSHGPPRPVGDFQDLRRLFCRLERRTIQSFGIEIDGLVFNSPVLEELRGRRGVTGEKWDIMVDPFDLRSVFLIDPLMGATEDTWREIPCTRQDLAANVTQHQHELHKMIARLTAPGEMITETMLLRARDRADAFLSELASGRQRTGTAARLARYREDGAFLTPVRISAPSSFEVEGTVDWGPARLDPFSGREIGASKAPCAVDPPETGSAIVIADQTSEALNAVPTIDSEVEQEALMLETMARLRGGS